LSVFVASRHESLLATVTEALIRAFAANMSEHLRHADALLK
jgi:hypothetical protein